jgi:hypothetical protein
LIVPGFGSLDVDVNLRGSTVRAERTAVFDRSPALLASVLHIIEASAQRTTRARQASGDLAKRLSGDRGALR